MQKHSGNRSLGRGKRKQKSDIKMGSYEICYGGADWIDLIQNRNKSLVFLLIAFDP
jgi:hypothetical protein